MTETTELSSAVETSSSAAGSSTAAPAKSSGGLLILILGALVLVNLYVFVWDKKTGVAAIKRELSKLPP